MSIVLFIVILVTLVWVHELGHLVAAKLFGIRVDSFNVGFGPELFGITVGETRYSFKPVLLGGYVAIHGESEEPGVPRDPRGLTAKPRPVQAAVMVAGIFFNIVFAWLVLTAGYMHGLPSAIDHEGYGQVQHAQATIVSVIPGSPAEKAGVVGGDTVVSVETGTDKLPAGADADQVHNFLVQHGEDSVVLHLSRNGTQKDFIVKAQSGLVEGRKVLGVELDDIGVLQLPPQLAVLQGGIVAKNILVAEASGLGGLIGGIFSGGADLNQVSGPIGIVSVGSQLVSQGFGTTVTIIALISINLALINILPIPGLDGGRLLFIVIESIIRRPLSPRVATALTVAGMALIVGLMALVSVHDIAKLVG